MFFPRLITISENFKSGQLLSSFHQIPPGPTCFHIADGFLTIPGEWNQYEPVVVYKLSVIFIQHNCIYLLHNTIYIYIYMYLFIFLYVGVCIYIYIQRERVRERER